MTNKILLCVSNTGSGHRSAANAIRNAIEELEKVNAPLTGNFEIVVMDVVEESNSINKFFVFAYNYLLRHKQEWMKYYFFLIEKFKPDNNALGFWLVSSYIKKLLRTLNPVIVVSVHPMANHYLSHALKEIQLPHNPKLLIVVTDPNAELWIGWASRDAALTVTPNDLASQQLVALGIEPSKILTIGMPVNPEFLHPALQSRGDFLREFGLAPDMLTICLLAGSAGGGNFVEIFGALSNVKKAFQVIVICGNNHSLLCEIQNRSQSMNFKTVAVPHLKSLSNTMNACDLLVTKAGGLTTFEAIARRLPMALDIITEPMPQESGTVKMLLETGLAKAIYHPSNIIDIVESLEHIENRHSLSLPKEHNLDQTDAVYEIARIILQNCRTGSQSERNISTSPTQRFQ